MVQVAKVADENPFAQSYSALDAVVGKLTDRKALNMTHADLEELVEREGPASRSAEDAFHKSRFAATTNMRLAPSRCDGHLDIPQIVAFVEAQMFGAAGAPCGPQNDGV